MDAVRPDEHDDPVAAVRAAHARGALISLPTSGTTAPAARRVVRTTESWWVTFADYSALSAVTAGSRLWVPGPATSTMVLFARVHAAVVGADVVASPTTATHACLTPARLARDVAPLRPGAIVTVAGAALTTGVLASAEAHGLEVRHYYGAAELSFVAAGRAGGRLRPFPGVEVEIRGAAAIGEIWVRSPWVCAGYEGPAGSLRRDDAGWATVGDLGTLHDGALAVHGRPDAVTTGGATVRVADVEAALLPRARAPLAVHGIRHPTLGEVVAVTLTDPGDRGPLERYAWSHLSAPARPRVWRVVPALPLTAAGKVDRARLAQEAER